MRLLNPPHTTEASTRAVRFEDATGMQLSLSYRLSEADVHGRFSFSSLVRTANSLRVTGVLEALSRDELVFLTAEELEALGDARFQAPPRTAQFGASTTAAARSSLRW